MNTQINYIDWGRMPYKEAWEKQQVLFQEKIDFKSKVVSRKSEEIQQDFILVEHEPVYTLGKHGKESNMLISEERLKQIGSELFHIDRGGDITYHGPGQITGYPIFDLEALGIGLKTYIHTLEEMIIRVIADYGIIGTRVEGATGVWLDAGTPKERKICAIGVRASRFVTMHGFALNVNTDLRYFSYINPCGFTDRGVTSIAQELGREVPIEEVKQKLYQQALQLFL